MTLMESFHKFKLKPVPFKLHFPITNLTKFLENSRSGELQFLIAKISAETILFAAHRQAGKGRS